MESLRFTFVYELNDKIPYFDIHNSAFDIRYCLMPQIYLLNHRVFKQVCGLALMNTLSGFQHIGAV
jgi:hypothetical protein